MFTCNAYISPHFSEIMTEGIVSPCGGFRLVDGDWVALDKDSKLQDTDSQSVESKNSQEVTDNVIQGNANISIDNEGGASEANQTNSNQIVENNVVQGDMNVKTTFVNNFNQVDLTGIDAKLDLILSSISNMGIQPVENPDLILSNQQSQEIIQQLDKVEEYDIQDAKILLMLGNAAKMVFHLDEAEDYFKMAKNRFSEDSNVAGEIMSLISLGGLQKEKGDNKQAISFFARAANYAQSENFEDLAARSYCDIGHIYLMLRQYKLAKDYLNKSLNLIDSETDDNIRLEVYLRLGELHSSNKNPEHNIKKAEKYLKNSLKISKKVNNVASINRIRLYLGDFEFTRNNLGKSILLFDEILKDFSDNEDNKLCLDANIGKGRVLYEQKKYDLAKSLFDECLQIAEMNDYNTVTGPINYHIGKCELERGNQQSAFEYFQSALISVEKISNLEIELQSNLEIGLILRNQGSEGNKYLVRARQLMKEMKL